MATRYATLEVAQKAADRLAHHIQMVHEWHEYRVRQLEAEVRRAEYKLEEAQEAKGMFEAKGDLSTKVF